MSARGAKARVCLFRRETMPEKGSETIVARLTAPGRAALATVGLCGPEAEAIACRVLFTQSGKPISGLPLRRIRTCLFRWGDRPPERVVACQLSPGVVHIHCHGGWAAVARVIGALVELGARQVEWPQWLAATSSTPWQAECLRALAMAPTVRVAQILADQLAGSFSREVKEVLTKLEGGRPGEAFAQLQGLRRRGELGSRLLSPWFVLLAGPANVGKSSLFNSIVGYERVIVHDSPGTTRDVVKKAVAVDGWPVVLGDSAGFRATHQPVELAAMDRARHALAQADLVLWVEDLSQPWQGPAEIFSQTPWPGQHGRRPAILYVHNKADVVPLEERAIRLRGRPVGLVTSALSGEGLPALWLAVRRVLIPDPPPPKAGIPITAEQRAVVEEAAGLLQANKFSEAKHLLQSFLMSEKQSPL